MRNIMTMNFRTNTIKVLAFACAGIVAAPAFAQQLTDAALISNKDWGSGSNQGFVVTMDDLNDGDVSTGRWKINAKAGPRGEVGSPGRIDTDWIPYTRGTWHYTVSTFSRNLDGTTLVSSYLDGVLVSSRTSGAGSFDTFDSYRISGGNQIPVHLDLNIGQDGTGTYDGSKGFLGLVDDVSIWRRSLSQEEITSIYSANSSLATVISSTPAIGTDLVGLYSFDGTANDTAGAPVAKNGVWRTNGTGTAEKYAGGRFGQAADLDGSNYVNIGDGITDDGGLFPDDYKFGTTTSFSLAAWFFETLPPLPTNATYLGTAANGLASNGANWDLPPVLWDETTIVIVGGPNATSQTKPVVFNTAFGTQTVKSFILGNTGQTVYANFTDGATLESFGNDIATIGAAGSTVTLNMTGGTIMHGGNGEEEQPLFIGVDGSVVTINMSGNSLLSTGNRVADAQFPSGFRRPAVDGSEGVRNGDDLYLAEGNGVGSKVTITMNGNANIHVVDVLYPGDANGDADTSVDVVQNDNSAVSVGWDTRWYTDGSATGQTVNWTMNDNSKFAVHRDHGLGESNGTGTINLTINDSAEFVAGDRIWLGAGGVGTQVNVVMNGGLFQVGGKVLGETVLADNTGGAPSQTSDWLLIMGAGSDAKLQVNAGEVSIGRSAYVGFNGGSAIVNLDGGTFNIHGVAPAIARIGNEADSLPFPALGAPVDSPWLDNGGDLLIAYGGTTGRSAPIGSFNIGGTGSLNVARDTFVGGTYYNGSLSEPAPGISSAMLSVRGGGASVNIGRDLYFGGVLLSGLPIVGGNTDAKLGAKITGNAHSKVNVAGNLYIFNDVVESVSSTVEAVIDVPYATYRPAAGTTYTLVEYGGTLTGAFASVTDNSVNGIDWNLFSDPANKQIKLVATRVYALGNTDRDLADTITTNDFNQQVAGFGSTGTKKWSDGDFTNDKNVDLADVAILRNAFSPSSVIDQAGNAVIFVGMETGEIRLVGSATSYAGLQITSPSESLIGAAFPSQTDFASILGAGATILSNIDSNVAVATLTGSASLSGGGLQADLEYLGAIYDITGARDLTFTYMDLTGGVPTAVLGEVLYMIDGDANVDGFVDALDYERIDLAIGNDSVFDPRLGDINFDGFVDALDYERVDLNIGNGVFPGGRPAGVFIPEPASLSLVAMAASLMGRRRRA